MQIDRRRFLALATGLFAAHCATGTGAPVMAPESAQFGGADASTPAATSDAKAGELAEHEAADADSEADAAVAVGLTAPWGGVRPGVAPIDVHGQPCPPADNMRGNPGSCALLRPPGPTCESFADTKEQCTELRALLKPRLAERAVRCHTEKSGTPAICKFNLASDCAAAAIASACVDPAASATCTGVMSACGGHAWSRMTADACIAAVSSVQTAYRSRFVACMTELCSFETCFYHLAEYGGGRRH
jgi:hypothetical protein